jgi:hypothetical protein
MVGAGQAGVSDHHLVVSVRLSGMQKLLARSAAEMSDNQFALNWRVSASRMFFIIPSTVSLLVYGPDILYVWNPACSRIAEA